MTQTKLQQWLTQLKGLAVRPNSGVSSTILFLTLVDPFHPPLCPLLTVIIIFMILIILYWFSLETIYLRSLYVNIISTENIIYKGTLTHNWQ